MKAKAQRIDESGIRPAMSFQEIGKALGISSQAVWQSYASAMKKLRRMRNGQRLQQMRALASELEREA